MFLEREPLQEFSSAGKRNEDNGRGDLTVSYAKIISNIRPEWFVMENVDRIKKTQKLVEAMKIYKEYGDDLYGIIKKNPYQLAEDIHGIGFKIADEIAAKIGIHTDSDYRIRSGILYTLLQAGNEGHCYLPKSILLERAGELLGLEPTLMEPQLQNLAMDRKLIIKLPSEGETEQKVYASIYYYAELNCAKMLHDLNVSVEYDEGMLPSEEKKILDKIDRIEAELGIALDELQKKSVLESVRNGICIL